MKVLFFRPTLASGGADRVTLTLLRELPRAGFRPSLALLRREGELVDRVPPDVAVHSLDVPNLRRAVGPLMRLIAREKPDVVFSTSSGGNVPAVLAVEALGHPCRLVLSERNVLFHGGKTLKRSLVTAAKRVLYPLADSLTAVSAGVARDMERQLGIPEHCVRVVYNPTLTDDMMRDAATPVSHRFFVDGAPPVVVAAGRFVKEKGFDVLLRAFVRVHEQTPCQLLLLGDGPLRSELEALVRELRLGEDVDMPGFDPNPFKYMSRAAVFVLSSRHEGLPGALIQAMACGAAAISTDCPSGPSEIIDRPGTDGLLVPVDDVDALAGAMARVLREPGLRAALASNGQAAASRFGLASSLARYVDAIWPDASAGLTGAA